MNISSITSKGVKHEVIDAVARAKAEDNARKIAESGSGEVTYPQITATNIRSEETSQNEWQVFVDLQFTGEELYPGLPYYSQYSVFYFEASDGTRLTGSLSNTSATYNTDRLSSSPDLSTLLPPGKYDLFLSKGSEERKYKVAEVLIS